MLDNCLLGAYGRLEMAHQDHSNLLGRGSNFLIFPFSMLCVELDFSMYFQNNYLLIMYLLFIFKFFGFAQGGRWHHT